MWLRSSSIYSDNAPFAKMNYFFDNLDGKAEIEDLFTILYDEKRRK